MIRRTASRAILWWILHTALVSRYLAVAPVFLPHALAIVGVVQAPRTLAGAVFTVCVGLLFWFTKESWWKLWREQLDEAGRILERGS